MLKCSHIYESGQVRTNHLSTHTVDSTVNQVIKQFLIYLLFFPFFRHSYCFSVRRVLVCVLNKLPKSVQKTIHEISSNFTEQSFGEIHHLEKILLIISQLMFKSAKVIGFLTIKISQTYYQLSVLQQYCIAGPPRVHI